MFKKKAPKNTDKYQWTEHVQMKMQFYGISEQKVLGVIRNPKRLEVGIVEDTVAVMQPVGSIKKGAQIKKSSFGNNFPKQENSDGENWNQEIWVLYKIKSQRQTSNVKKSLQNPKLKKLQEKINSKKQLVIISAWRYPGMAPEHDPIPSEIMRELEEMAVC